MTTTEQRLKDLAWAAMNYLEWRERPHEFVGEPLELLLTETRAALELLEPISGDSKAQLHGLNFTYRNHVQSNR